MKKAFVIAWMIFMVWGCGRSKNVPDVSNIKVNIQLQRFEQDFFSIDTNNVDVSLQQLHQKYPGFLQDFIFNILALPAHPDSSQAVQSGVRSFIRSYKSIKDSSDKIFNKIESNTNEISNGLKFVKHYFPSYQIPRKVITFIGPVNSYGNILTTDALGIGLQLYLGRNFSLYQSQQGQELYPSYISRRFEPQYIPVNCMKNIIDDMYPDNSAGRSLVEQMTEAGKRLYLLDHLLPETADTLKTGYTEAQLKGCYESEALIWGFFLRNDLLFTAEPSVIKDYMNDGPKTPALGEASPGFIGQFVGWQIVKKWMDKNENVSLEVLMDTPAKTIFEQAKYKPR